MTRNANSRRGRRLWPILMLTLVAGLGACSSKKPRPADDIILEHGQPPLSDAYALRPGDTIAVKFYNTPQLNEDKLLVGPDGNISLPYVGTVRVAGKSASEVERELRDGYSAELAGPRDGASLITVILRRLGSYHVHVGGEVEKDGRVPIQGQLTLMEAVQRAGGLLETADGKRVVVIRGQRDSARVGYVVDLRPVMKGAEPDKDVVLQPGDIVFVPRSTIAKLNLIVKQYIRDMLPVEPAYAVTP